MLRENYKLVDVSVEKLLSINVCHKKTIFSAILPVKNMGGGQLKNYKSVAILNFIQCLINGISLG